MPAIAPDQPAATNHVFVDFENVHKVDLSVIGHKTVSFTLLVGANQSKLDVSLVEKLFEHAISVELVRLTSSGRNALDFTIAYYLGRAVTADPTGTFHIVSRDAGYDPLIAHLQSRNISAFRHNNFESLPFIKAGEPALSPLTPSTTPRKAKTPPPATPADQPNGSPVRVIEHLRTHPKTRPTTKKRLVRFLISHLGPKTTEPAALKIVDDFSAAGHIQIAPNGRVAYQFAGS